MSIHYKKRHLPSSLWSEGNHLSPPHWRDFKDCKQILEDLLKPALHIKDRARLQQAKLSEDLRPLHFYNSLRSINTATAGCSLQKPTRLFAYRSRQSKLQFVNTPTPQGRMIAESPDRIRVLIPDYKNAWHLDTSVIAGLTGNYQQYQAHIRYFLIDSQTGYRSREQQISVRFKI